MKPLPHHYEVRLTGGPEGYAALSSAGVPELRSAPPLDFDGPGDAWSPEYLLLAAVETNRITPGEIDPARRQRLTARRDPALRARAEAAFQQQAQARKAVVDAYQSALRMKGDPATGASLFRSV